MRNKDASVQTVRRFGRFYTRKIGALNRGLLDSPFSLPEARVLYEVARRPGVIARELVRDLEMDRGYLSRIVSHLDKQGLLERRASEQDARRHHLQLSDSGRTAFADLDRRSSRQAAAFLEHLSPADQHRLAEHLDAARFLLSSPQERATEPILREPRPGDLGWVVQRHGALYAAEFGWNEEFEGLVAGIVGQFARKHDPRRERAWIAELDGHPVGCVFLVRQSAGVAKLRLLMVEPSARGKGIGHRLVMECLQFAQEAGYRKVTLWTNSVLHAARRIYERAGFHLVKSESHHSFGHDLVGQYWEKRLV